MSQLCTSEPVITSVFSEQEWKILELVMADISLQEIPEQLSLRSDLVRRDFQSILNKLIDDWEIKNDNF